MCFAVCLHNVFVSYVSVYSHGLCAVWASIYKFKHHVCQRVCVYCFELVTCSHCDRALASIIPIKLAIKSFRKPIQCENWEPLRLFRGSCINPLRISTSGFIHIADIKREKNRLGANEMFVLRRTTLMDGSSLFLYKCNTLLLIYSMKNIYNMCELVLTSLTLYSCQEKSILI